MALQFTQYKKVETPTLTSIYKLYDFSNNEIPILNWTISGLENAYYYTKGVYDTTKKRIGGRIFYVNNDIAESTSTDKFYVYDTTNGLQSSLTWSDNYSTVMECTSSILGAGKTNSARMLAAKGDTSGTIWHFIKNTMNANSVGGCNDWYIGSTLENEELRNVNLVDWFSSNVIWSSVEVLNNPNAWALYWNYVYGHLDGYGKNYTRCCFAIRSF